MKKYTLAHVSILMSLFYLTSLVGDYIHYSPENIFTYFDFYRVRFNSILLPCIALSIVTIKLRENINFMSYTYVISFLLLLQVFIHQFVSNKFNFWNETILIHITVMSFCCLILFISIVLNRTPKKKNPKIQKIKNILTNLTLLTSVILGVYSFVVYQGPDELYLLGSSIIVSLFLFSNIKYRLIISLMLVILNTLHVSFWVIDLQNIKFIYTLSWLLSIFFVFGFLIFKVSKNIKLNKKSTFILFISIPLLYKANFELLDYLAYKVHFKEIIIDYGENKSELNYYDPSKKILNLLEKYNGYKVKVHINRDLLVGSPLDGCMRASPYEILLDKGDNINNFNDIISHLNSDNIMRLKKTINDAYEKNKKMSHSELQSFLMYTKFNDNSFSIHQKTLILIDKMKDKTDILKKINIVISLINDIYSSRLEGVEFKLVIDKNIDKDYYEAHDYNYVIQDAHRIYSADYITFKKHRFVKFNNLNYFGNFGLYILKQKDSSTYSGIDMDAYFDRGAKKETKNIYFHSYLFGNTYELKINIDKDEASLSLYSSLGCYYRKTLEYELMKK